MKWQKFLRVFLMMSLLIGSGGCCLTEYHKIPKPSRPVFPKNIEIAIVDMEDGRKGLIYIPADVYYTWLLIDRAYMQKLEAAPFWEKKEAK